MESIRGRGRGGYYGGYTGRYAVLGYDSANDDGEWLSQGGKRRRRFTGGTFNSAGDNAGTASKPPELTTHKFKAMTMDEKLVALFELFNTRVTTTERNIEHVNKRMTSHERRLLLLEYKSIDMEARNRRNNLIFRGIAEANFAAEEDCASLVKDFIYDHLDLGIVPVIQRAHRLGNPDNLRKVNRRRQARGQPTTTRPIIACFRDSADVEAILNNANKLKDKPRFGINKDYPSEITQARSQLWPLYKSERDKNPNAKVYIGFPAKLVVRGQVKKDLFPEWHTILRGSRCNNDNECQETFESPDQDREIVTDAEPMQTTSSSQENFADASAEIAQGVLVEADTESNENLMETAANNEDKQPIPNPSNSDEEPAPSPYDEAMLRLLNRMARGVDPPPNDRPSEQTISVRPRSSSVPRSRDKDHKILQSPKLQLSQK